MSPAHDLYDLSLRWPYTTANQVIVTGTFDKWSRSVHMRKTNTGFEGSVRVPWSEKVLFKFVVDGRWTTSPEHPTEYDGAGNINNVVKCPAKPASVADIPAVLAPEAVNPALKATAVTPSATNSTSQTISDIVDTIAAKDGVSNAVSYVATGVGAAINGFIGVDPVNPKQVPVESPKVETVPEPIVEEKNSNLEIAPIVPIGIVPVNVPEMNSTTSVSSETAYNAASTHQPAAIEPESAAEPTSPSPPPHVMEKPVEASPPAPVSTATAAPASSPAITNGTNGPATNGLTPTTTNGTIATTPPTTPKKQSFPSTDSPNSSLRGSPDSRRNSRFSIASRKKRDSLFGKIKGLFNSPDKEKEKGHKKETSK